LTKHIYSSSTMYFKPIRRSINQRKARLCEKGNAEEDGNCAIHGRSSNRPLRSCHWNQIVYRHPFEHQTKLAWRLSALSNQIFDFCDAEMTSRYRPLTIDPQQRSIRAKMNSLRLKRRHWFKIIFGRSHRQAQNECVDIARRKNAIINQIMYRSTATVDSIDGRRKKASRTWIQMPESFEWCRVEDLVSSNVKHWTKASRTCVQTQELSSFWPCFSLTWKIKNKAGGTHLILRIYSINISEFLSQRINKVYLWKKITSTKFKYNSSQLWPGTVYHYR
jgi:hypothetical protein